MYYTNDDIRVIMALNESLDGSTVKVNFTDPESTVTTEVSPTTIDGQRVTGDWELVNGQTISLGACDKNRSAARRR